MWRLRGGSIHEYSDIAPIRIQYANEADVILFSELERKQNEFVSYAATMAAAAARRNGFEQGRKWPQNI
jgi:hypothetical protein